MRRFIFPAAAGAAAAAALIAATLAYAGPPSGWVFGPMPNEANITFMTDSGQPATYEVFTSPQPITGLVCPAGAHAVFPFNGNSSVGECGPFSPGLVTGVVTLSGPSPFPCDASFGDQASFDSQTYTPQTLISSLNSCQTTTPPPATPVFSSHAAFATDLRPQLTKQWNLFVERQLGQSASLNVGYIQAKSTPAGSTIVYDPGFWKVYTQQGGPPGAVMFPFQGALAGPGTVQISILEQKAPGSCTWMTGTGGSFRAGPCSRPVWLPTVTHDALWDFVTRRALPPGTYTAEVRATDAGQVETIFSAGSHNLKRIKVEVRHK